MMIRQQQDLGEAIRRRAPPRPGIYLFRDHTGGIIYVGKSVNLRQRMLSYFPPGQAGQKRRTRQMAFAVRDFEYRETRSELLALLL